MKWHRYLAVLSICVMLCGLFPASTLAEAPLHPLDNGDFDSGSLHGWQAIDGVSASKAAAYEGAYGCLITGDGDWDDLLSQTFTVLPGYTYTLAFWYKANPMGVSWYLVDGGADGVRLRRGWAGKTEWTKAEVEFTPSTDTVYLLFRGSGSHVAEKVYLDSVLVTIHPCSTHAYDNHCDSSCNICGEIRQVGDHLYDSACDAFCNYCSAQRVTNSAHTYAYPCATLCAYCGAPRTNTGAHSYGDVCDVDCDRCGEVREVPHFYDDIYDADCNRCGALRIPAPKPMERLSYGGAACSTDVNGLAFRFYLEVDGAKINPDFSYITNSGMVERYNNGVQYQLVRVGAVMSNEKNPIMDLEHLTDRTIDIKAGRLCEVAPDHIAFAVRIINIPAQGRNTVIQARPYYVYSDGEEYIVVYGDIVSQTFNNLYNAL